MIINIIFSFFCQCYFKFLIYLVFIKIRSINTTPTTRFSIALLSVKENARRTANVICLPNHIIWKMKTFEEVKAFLVKSFPQIDFSTFVTDEEIARFATSDSGMFPEPQYIKGIQQLFKEQKKGKN